MVHKIVAEWLFYDPGNWDIDERMIATRSLDTAGKAAHRADWAQMKQLMRIQVIMRNGMRMQTTEKRQKARYKKDMTLVNVLDWEGEFGPDAPVGERSVTIVLPRAEKKYEIEKTCETAGVAVFANYRGEAPMHELVPQMVGLMWTFWNESKVKPPEEHDIVDNIANHGDSCWAHLLWPSPGTGCEASVDLAGAIVGQGI